MKDLTLKTQPDPLLPRSLTELLNETFGIYGAHLKDFLVLVAIVQVPLGLLLLLHTVFVDPNVRAAMYVSLIASSLGTSAQYGAASTAVGQHYVTGNIKVWDCYKKGVLWRLVSLIWLTAMLAIWFIASFAILGFILALLMPLGNFVLIGTLMLVPFFILMQPVIWLFTSIPAVVTERIRSIPALRRTYRLFSGSQWRIFGIFWVLVLVTLGLAIVITIPFSLLSELYGTEQISTTFITIRFMYNIFVTTIVTPVLIIGGTLLYYDLRVRKEQYNVSTLSQEIGIAAA
tara:strand:+ start:57 stop:920 length:864 start_codon:yes stop_codon:yes gene_type:complete